MPHGLEIGLPLAEHLGRGLGANGCGERAERGDLGLGVGRQAQRGLGQHDGAVGEDVAVAVDEEEDALGGQAHLADGRGR